MICLADLKQQPNARTSILAGALCGCLSMVRSEQLALLALLALTILVANGLCPVRRLRLIVLSTFTCFAFIAPWTAYNASRFELPFLLSTNGGSTLLAGNCPPKTYTGDRVGYFDTTCEFRIAVLHPGIDRSRFDRIAYDTARRNMHENRGILPSVALARIGRMLALYEPAQTVSLTAGWMMSPEWLVWSWVASYWAFLSMALAGAALAFRSGAHILPLLTPLLLSFAISIATYGEPRYHSLSDLGVMVLAAFLLDRVLPARIRLGGQ
jgi:hypothetical protein